MPSDNNGVCSFYPCAWPAWQEGSYCIFHEPLPDKDTNAFQQELNKYTLANPHEWDFTRFHFPPGVSFEEKELPEVTFQQSFFYGHVGFKGAIFSGDAQFFGTTFTESADFDKATFSGDVGFRRATFAKIVFFTGQTTFFGEADFLGATFSDDAVFQRATFSGETDFREVNFNKCAHFSGAYFSGNADFSEASFFDVTNFNRTIFSGNTVFAEATFSEVVDFTGCEISGRLLFQGKHETEFYSPECFKSEALFNHLNLKPSADIVFRSIDLSNAHLLNTDVTDIRFEDIKWPAHIWWKFKRKCICEDVEQLKKNEMPAVEILYRRLKHSCTTRSDYVSAGDFHVGEMEMKRRQLEWYRPDKILLLLYKIVSFYGERWLRPLIVLFSLLFVFSVLEIGLGVKLDGKIIQWARNGSFDLKQVLQNFADIYSYGLQIAALQRPSDVTQVRAGTRLVVAALGLIAPSLIALSLLAMRRRFKR